MNIAKLGGTSADLEDALLRYLDAEINGRGRIELAAVLLILDNVLHRLYVAQYEVKAQAVQTRRMTLGPRKKAVGKRVTRAFELRYVARPQHARVELGGDETGDILFGFQRITARVLTSEPMAGGLENHWEFDVGQRERVAVAKALPRQRLLH